MLAASNETHGKLTQTFQPYSPMIPALRAFGGNNDLLRTVVSGITKHGRDSC
jgi:hypothetical protein